MIKYLAAVPIVLMIVFALGGVLSHLPIPLRRCSGGGKSERSYGFYLGVALFLGNVGLAIASVIDGYFLLTALFFAVALLGGGCAIWSFFSDFREGAYPDRDGIVNSDTDVKNEKTAENNDDGCRKKYDEKNDLDKNFGEENCGRNGDSGQKTRMKDGVFGIIMRFKKNIAQKMTKKLLFISVILCAVLVISMVFTVVFATAFRPLDSSGTVYEKVVFTKAEANGNVLFLYTDAEDTVYAVFGYKKCLNDPEGFIARAGCEGAYTVGSIPLDRDEWSAYNAVQSIVGENGEIILTAEGAVEARSASVISVNVALWTVNGLLVALDGFCFLSYFLKKRGTVAKA